MIFGDVEIAKNIDFSRFCRTRYRTQNGGRGVGRRDMPFLASGDLLQNVNHAPTSIKTYNNSTVLWCIFYCQVQILYALRLPDCYIVSLSRKHLYFYQRQKSFGYVRVSNTLEKFKSGEQSQKLPYLYP